MAVIDLEAPSLVWSFGAGVLERQHDASLLPNGHVLLFDNGRRRGWSRVLEVDPAGEIVREWSGDPPRSLWTARQGAVQHLPNGNLLVTESERGRVLEVSPEGRVVWEYLNPEIDEEEDARATIWRMRRHAEVEQPSLRMGGAAPG